MPILGSRGLSPRGYGFAGAGKPNAPVSVVATDVGTARAFNDGAASVAFSSGGDNGAPITSFVVTSSPDNLTVSGASSPLVVTGLASNSSYTFTVTATNSVGTSDASTVSTAITATTVPQAPTIGTASGTSGAVSVPFTAQATGGEAISTFTVTSTSTLIGTGATSPITVTETSEGTRTYSVTATNINGTSLASAESNSITTSFPYVLSQTFNSSGTFTVPANKNLLAFAVISSGLGGGTGAAGTTSGSSTATGGAGGSGGKGGGGAQRKDVAVTPGQTFSVTVGSTSNFGNLASASANSQSAPGGTTISGASGGSGAPSNPRTESQGPGAAGGNGGGGNSITISGVQSFSIGGGGGGGGSGQAVGSASLPAPAGGAGGSGSSGGGSGGSGGNARADTDGETFINGIANAGNVGASSSTRGGGGGGGGGGGAARASGPSNIGEFSFSVVGAARSGGSGAAGQVIVFVK